MSTGEDIGLIVLCIVMGPLGSDSRKPGRNTKALNSRRAEGMRVPGGKLGSEG